MIKKNKQELSWKCSHPQNSVINSLLPIVLIVIISELIHKKVITDCDEQVDGGLSIW